MLDTELIGAGPGRLRLPFSSSTMKHTFLVTMFAAFASLAAAQEKAEKDPRVELAKVIAVEEQERDLAKAETLYREAIADAALSAAARELANRRLGHLLRKLGREAEAQPFLKAGGTDKGAIATLDDVTNGLQDREREQALREKARELVQGVLANPGANAQVENLMWVGEPAIPEIAAALTGKSANPHTATGQGISALAGLLWYFGTPAAETQLEGLLRAGDAQTRRCIVAGAGRQRDPRMLRFAERWLQQEKDEEVAMQLLTTQPSGRPFLPIDTDVLLDDAARRAPGTQVWVLGTMGNREYTRSALAKAHALARTFLAGADPELGQAAQRFLGKGASQSSPEGVELLVQQLPHIRNGSIGVEDSRLPDEWLLPKPPEGGAAVRPEAAARLWPQLVACAMALQPESQYRRWLDNRLSACARALDAAIVPDVLALIERGIGDPAWLRGKVNAANAAAVLSTYDKVEAGAREELLKVLGRADLPADLFEPLRERAAARAAADPKEDVPFAEAIAMTGHPDAGPWLLAFLKRGAARDDAMDALVALGRRSQDEKVRTAMREAVRVPEKNEYRGHALLALLSMHDEGALPLVVEQLALTHSSQSQGVYSRDVATVHPYATKRTNEPVTPLQYLLYPDPDPPHGFSADELVAFMPLIGTAPGIIVKSGQVPGTPALDATKLTDRLLTAGFEAGIEVTWAPSGMCNWGSELLQRIERQGADGPLHRWFDESLRNRGAALGLLHPAKAKQLEQVRPTLDALLGGDDEAAAVQVMNALAAKGLPLDFAALLQSKHGRVRRTAFWFAIDRGELSNEAAIAELANNRDHRIAEYLGSRVAVEAVPALIGLLKDRNDVVRVAAADALTKIRFHHEQQSYWDRIVKGLDSSPASAAEKLLLQARPGAPKAQRLLAITSLGTLGAPEALPFLIEWTADADADVAKKANEAITQIHLNPRK